MAHFAEIGLNNKVLRVIVVANEELLDENGVEQESKGAEFCRTLLGGTWVQTSYNASFRKQYAGINHTYDLEADVFIAPQPYPSWSLDEAHDWQAPVAYPDGEDAYYWDEDTLSWVSVSI
jgi:hypothetical protein